MMLSDIDLASFIIDFMTEKILKFNFRTPHQNNQYLEKCFIFLQNKNVEFTNDEKNSLINKLKSLKKEILKLLLDKNSLKSDKYIDPLNENLLNNLLMEINYTIFFLSDENDLDSNLYELLDYVIFTSKDINVFLALIKSVDYQNCFENKKIIDKVLDRYYNCLISNNQYNKFYYQLILEKLFKKLELADLKIVLDSIEKFIVKNKKVLMINQNITDINNLVEQITNKKVENIDKFFPYDIDQELANLTIIDENEFIDLTNKKLLSIDTCGTKIKENLFSVDFLPNGYLLTLYVPAITSYIKKDSLIEKIAYQRGITLAKTDLFPKKFLYENCSFDQGKDRYAYAYKFYFYKDFSLVNVSASKVIINVDANLDNDEVLELLNQYSSDWVVEQLHYLKWFSQVLTCSNDDKNYFWIKTINNYYRKRENRDENDKISRKIIDNLTIYSNYQMANYFFRNDLPFIFRNNEFNNDANLIGKLNDYDIDLSDVLDKLRVDSYFSAYNCGHNGLKKEAYCQISTPLRNYAAYTCQKLIDLFLVNNMDMDLNVKQKMRKELEIISQHLNLQYKANEECLNEVTSSKVRKR